LLGYGDWYWSLAGSDERLWLVSQ